MLNSQKHASYETSYDRVEIQEKSHFNPILEILLKQEFFRWVTNIHEHKRYYYAFDNSLLFTESIEHYPNLSTLNHNVPVSSVSAPGVGIMQYVYALNPVCIVFTVFPDTPEKFPRQGYGHNLIQEYNDDSSHPSLININNMKFQLIV